MIFYCVIDLNWIGAKAVKRWNWQDTVCLQSECKWTVLLNCELKSKPGRSFVDQFEFDQRLKKKGEYIFLPAPRLDEQTLNK